MIGIAISVGIIYLAVSVIDFFIKRKEKRETKELNEWFKNKSNWRG